MLLLRDNQEETFDRSAGRKGPSSGPRRGMGAFLTPASPSPPARWSGNLMPDLEAFFKKFPPFSFTGFEGYFPNYPTGTPGFLLCSSALAFSVSVSTKSLAALSEQEQQGTLANWRGHRFPVGGAVPKPLAEMATQAGERTSQSPGHLVWRLADRLVMSNV